MAKRPAKKRHLTTPPEHLMVYRSAANALLAPAPRPTPVGGPRRLRACALRYRFMPGATTKETALKKFADLGARGHHSPYGAFAGG